jgi:rifampicin phosphotransferase
LSHAAIVSRELGIPTVIGALNATQIITDNSLIQINGTTGQIDIIE